MNKYRIKIEPLLLKAMDREDAKKRFREYILKDYKGFYDFVKQSIDISLEEGFEFYIKTSR